MDGYRRRVPESCDGQPFMEHLGARLDAAGEGAFEQSVSFSQSLTQQHGFFHAGVMAILADDTGGFAAYSLLSDEEHPLTVEFIINLFQKAVCDRLVSWAKVFKSGQTLKVSQVEVFERDSDEETCLAIAIVTVIATRIR